MEPPHTRINNENEGWDPKAYVKGNHIQREAFLSFLKEYDISLKGKDVVDAGCGPGDLTAVFAQTANFVLGFDASKQMAAYANEHHSGENALFEHCRAEEFKSEKKFDMIASSFCMHWVKGKQ